MTTRPDHPPDAPAPDEPDEARPSRRPAPGRRAKGYFLPGVIALGALLAIGVFFVGAGDLQHPANTQLAGADIESEIALAIQAQQNSTRAPAVTCPAREPVRPGLHFQCTVAAGRGRPVRPVYVTEVDGRGRIRWSFAKN